MRRERAFVLALFLFFLCIPLSAYTDLRLSFSEYVAEGKSTLTRENEKEGTVDKFALMENLQ